MTDQYATLAKFQAGEDDPKELIEWKLTPTQYEKVVQLLMQFGPGRRIE